MNTQTEKKMEKKKEKEYPVIEIGKARMILSQKILGQIASLHAIVGNKEWSGILFYTIKKGVITDPKTLEIVAQELILFDIGNSAYTEYKEFGVELLEIFDESPRLEKPGVYYGHIHSHHNMSAFFSGTDMSELHTNVGGHTFYLSLIVNFEGTYAAKLAYLADVNTKNTFKMKNQEGKIVEQNNITTTEQAMVITDFEFIVANEKYSANRVSLIRERKAQEEAEEAKKRAALNQRYNMFNYSSYNDPFEEDFYHRVEKGKEDKKRKKITVKGYQTTDMDKLKEQAKIRTFLAKWICNSLETTEMLAKILIQLESDYVTRPDYVDIALDTMLESFIPFSEKYFKLKATQESISDLAKECDVVLSKFSSFQVVEKVRNVIDMFIDDEASLSEQEEYENINKELNNTH